MGVPDGKAVTLETRSKLKAFSSPPFAKKATQIGTNSNPQPLRICPAPNVRPDRERTPSSTQISGAHKPAIEDADEHAKVQL